MHRKPRQSLTIVLLPLFNCFVCCFDSFEGRYFCTIPVRCYLLGLDILMFSLQRPNTHPSTDLDSWTISLPPEPHSLLPPNPLRPITAPASMMQNNGLLHLLLPATQGLFGVLWNAVYHYIAGLPDQSGQSRNKCNITFVYVLSHPGHSFLRCAVSGSKQSRFVASRH